MQKFNENFDIVNKAITLSSNEGYSVLKQEDESIKCFALLALESANNQEEINLLTHHLINHQSPTREACSFALLNLINEKNVNLLLDENNLNILLHGILDINPNVCRNVIELIKNDDLLSKTFFPILINNILELLEDFKNFEKEFGVFKENKMRDKKNHAKNKKLFNLYWSLEALSEILKEEYIQEKIETIVDICSNFLDYTIREKAAKILIKMKNPKIELLQKLRNDENFYVKNLLCDKILVDSN